MAAPTIYTSPADFPPKIPAICEAEGFAACADKDRFPRLSGRQDSFVYRVSHERCIADVYGSQEEDGTVCFYVAERWCWSRSLLRSRREFRDRIVASLIREGAQVVMIDMIEAYERKNTA